MRRPARTGLSAGVSGGARAGLPTAAAQSSGSIFSRSASPSDAQSSPACRTVTSPPRASRSRGTAAAGRPASPRGRARSPASLPVDLQPPALVRSRQRCRATLGARSPVRACGRAEGHAEEPDAGIRIFDAFGDQRHLGAVAQARHRHQLDPVADRAERADKVMADARADKRRQVEAGRRASCPDPGKESRR